VGFKSVSQSLEHLGKVRSLDNKIVNGYKAMNCIVFDPKQQFIFLFEHELYSTQLPN
jgi:hypothetical protein